MGKIYFVKRLDDKRICRRRIFQKFDIGVQIVLFSMPKEESLTFRKMLSSLGIYVQHASAPAFTSRDLIFIDKTKVSEQDMLVITLQYGQYSSVK